MNNYKISIIILALLIGIFTNSCKKSQIDCGLTILVVDENMKSIGITEIHIGHINESNVKNANGKDSLIMETKEPFFYETAKSSKNEGKRLTKIKNPATLDILVIRNEEEPILYGREQARLIQGEDISVQVIMTTEKISSNVFRN